MVLISGMEEKCSQGASGGGDECTDLSFHSASLLTSVRLQFLSGCFSLGAVSSGGLKGESVQLHHYQVIAVYLFKSIQIRRIPDCVLYEAGMLKFTIHHFKLCPECIPRVM